MTMEERPGRPDRVMVISLDAVGNQDLEYMKTLPNFRAFFGEAALCDRVESVYPSLTYPAHTSILTGRMPVHHGICNNTKLQPGRERPDWIYQRKYIKSTTLWDEARKKKNQHRRPAVARGGEKRSAVLRAGGDGDQKVADADSGQRHKRPDPLPAGLKQAVRPFAGRHPAACAGRFHPCQRPVYHPEVQSVPVFPALDGRGYQPPYIRREPSEGREALERHDRRLGELLQALRETGEMEKTAVFLLGDHYQKDARRIAFVNYALHREGLIDAKEGKVKSWRAVAKSCDGSCYVYLHPMAKKDPSLAVRVEGIIRRLAEREDFGIGRVFSAEEATSLGADPDCFLMLEARDGWYFLDDWRQEQRPVEEEKAHKMRGTHGYLPDAEGYEPFLQLRAAASGL